MCTVLDRLARRSAPKNVTETRDARLSRLGGEHGVDADLDRLGPHLRDAGHGNEVLEAATSGERCEPRLSLELDVEAELGPDGVVHLVRKAPVLRDDER